MSGHKRDYRSRGEDDQHSEGVAERRYAGVAAADRPAPRKLKPIGRIAVLVGLMVWSAIALIGYVSIDSLLGWVATIAGNVVGSGKDLATAVGVGKEQVSAVEALNVSGILGQAIILLKIIAKPAIVILWGVGVIALLAAPLILSRAGRLFALRRH
ncbi:MAG: hypothetical protein WC889_00505 [Myxococcota bacterium]